ncbi:uncharacterized protein LOC129570500 [Sitodiplosis mosellana]|uniref:uncharacterized protein LOC129570500 n=1 Tax=Sitodiplosis mosellana TaxID=263140 RepID=UPI002444A527|nr:uncharacterized protein LOC129570500 [Sitodiplosis mosellana]
MTKFSIVLLNIFCIGIVVVLSDKSSDTLVYVNNLQTKLKLPPNSNINLVVGNTGVGKSTYVHYAAGDYSKMISHRSGRKLKIFDGLDPELNRTTFATESRTLIPEMVIDEDGYVWYDCPGFGDTHNETVEIATSFLIKNIIENASFVKIVFVVDYEAVTEGYNRDGFDKLLSGATQLIKNIERYKQSFSLVITKVPQSDEFGELLDVDVKSSAFDFIDKHRKFLQTKKLSEKKIQLIDALLEQNASGDYPRISIFWRPSQAGSFDGINRMTEGRRKTRESILQHCSYVEIQNNDFGFPLTAEAQIEVHNITKNSIDNISNDLQSIVNQVLNEIQLEIGSVDDFEEKLYLIELAKRCVNVVQNKTDNNVIGLKQLTERLKKIIQTFEIETIDKSVFDRMEHQDVNLHIFLSLIETEASQSNSGKNYDSFLEKITERSAKWERSVQERIMNEAQHTIANISTVLTDVDTQILALVKKRLQSIDLFQNRLEWLHLLKADINAISGEFKLENKIKEFEVFIEYVNISSTNFKLLNNLKRLRSDLVQMKLSASSVITDPVYDWMTKSSSTVDYLTSQYDWYSFLQKTYNFFGSYEVQKDISLYNVAHLSDWGKIDKPQDLLVDADNYNEFTQKITTLDFTPTEWNLRELNDIINVTLKSRPQHEYNDEHSSVTIKGNFVRSSDILPFTTIVSLKRINVFVVDTFYVDCNLTLNPFNEVELNILAHTWNIRQDATFHLNGAKGANQYQPTTSGTAGRHGIPGTNAGDFFGFANSVVDGDLLTVELNGGNGGNGQDGSGSEDYRQTFKSVELKEELVGDSVGEVTKTLVENYFSRNGFFFYCSRNDISTFNNILIIRDYGRKYMEYVLMPRGCCGKTGQGGEGGLGGHEGYFTFIRANNKSGLPKHTGNTGFNGLSGSDGSVCSTYQLDVSVICNWSFVLWYKVKAKIQKMSSSLYSGCPVRYSYNEEKIAKPKPKSNKLTYALAVVKYKTFLLEKMSSESLLKTIQNTYNAIDFNSDINSAYLPTEFAIEMNALEMEFIRLNDHINMLPMYSNLLKRMDEYSRTKVNNLSNADRKLLTQLYLIALSRKMSIENAHNGDLIVDINNVFHVISEYIEKLNANERINVITEQRDRYKNELREKITKANDFIKNDIEPEIEKTYTVLNVEMQKTLNESIALQAKQRVKIRQKEEKANEIRRMAMIHKLIAIAKLAIGVLSSAYEVFFKPVDLLTSETDRTGRTVSKTSTIIEENYQEKLNLMDSELGQLVSFVNGNEDSGKNRFSKRLIDLHSQVKRVKLEQSYSRTSILLLECTEFIQHTLTNPTNETAPGILQRMKKTSNFFVAIASNYQNYRQYSEDDGKLEEISKSINQDMKTLTELMRLEDQIHFDLLPTINEMHTHLRNVGKNFTDKSSEALDVMKWKTHDILRAIQKKLGDAISGRSTEYGINNCLVRIGETMNLLIDIYDHIQGHQEQSRLISYLSDLQSMNHQNVQLPQNIEFIQLEMNLQTNLILSLYNRAMNAFKQAIFPYAAEYLDFYQLPSTLIANNSDMNQYTTVVTHKIQSLREKMQIFNATVINSNDMSIHVAEFNNEPGSRGPFYAWSNNEVHDQIEQLFNGTKIYLLADVERSDKRNAIKFATIDIEFRSANQTVKGQLSEILESFHVSMTHMGESNYRCNNEFYTIPSRPLTIGFSFGGKNNKPTDRNAAYDKLVAGFSLLSPYTLWAVQLRHGDFDKLKPFAHLVDIELHGFGQYVEEGASICNSNLEKYYKLKDVAHG